MYCFTIGNPSGCIFLLSLIGKFSVVVVIFVCLIKDVVDPFGFWIISSTGCINVSLTVFGSIDCPGIRTNVFSSFFLIIEIDPLISLSLCLPRFILSLSGFIASFWFWLSFSCWLRSFCLALKLLFKFFLESSKFLWESLTSFCLLLFFEFENLFLDGLFWLLCCFFPEETKLGFLLILSWVDFFAVLWISCSFGIWEVWIKFSIFICSFSTFNWSLLSIILFAFSFFFGLIFKFLLWLW